MLVKRTVMTPDNGNLLTPAGGPLVGMNHGNQPLVAQAYKDISSDDRRGLRSFFAYGKRSAEREAFQQAHITASGVPGVLNLMVCDPNGAPIPFTPFEWNGRQMLTDAKGMIKYIEKDYFQTAISLENERQKFVTQSVSLVVGQPSENVIALFGVDFYRALAGDPEGVTGRQAERAQRLYASYVSTAGLRPDIATAKKNVFLRYSDAECSPEVMTNFGDNDPEWSRAYNKLTMLLQYHPTAIIYDEGTLNPLDASGTVHGDRGAKNRGPLAGQAKDRKDQVERILQEPRFEGAQAIFPDSNTGNF